MYAQADVLVDPRPLDSEFASQSFPSKLLEYLASGIPVVSTSPPSIPAGYRDHLELGQSRPEAVAAAIDRRIAKGSSERHQLGAKARGFILKTRGSAARGSAIRSFLGTLVAERAHTGCDA